MPTTRIARSISAQTPNLFSVLSCALVVSFALVLATAATAAPNAERLAQSDIDRWNLGDLAEVTTETPAGTFILAQAGNDAGRSRPLEPTYQPREPEPKSWYNGSYIFSLTRSVADSTIAPAGQVPLYVLTVPLDIAFLPFALIGGLFG